MSATFNVFAHVRGPRGGLQLRYDPTQHICVLYCGTEVVYEDRQADMALYGTPGTLELVHRALQQREGGTA